MPALSQHAISTPTDAQWAEPRLEVSELERAIGGRFSLPSLDMKPEADVRAHAAMRESLADSLERAASLVRSNDIEQARRLLEDVVVRGDDRQRLAARDLLSRLG